MTDYFIIQHMAILQKGHRKYNMWQLLHMWYCIFIMRVEGVDQKYCMSSVFSPRDLFDETAQKSNYCHETGSQNHKKIAGL